MTKLRGAIHGCGMISEFHLRGWNRIPEVEIVALCNRTLSRAEQRRAEFVPGARVYQNLESMLAHEQLDFLDILTTPEMHARDCLAARRAGLHVICQKPLCPTLEEARGLVAAMQESPRIFAVHENHRYRPWFQRVREQFLQGRFGELSLLHVEHLIPTEPREAYKKEAKTGVWLEYGSHLVDMMRSLLGEPKRVHARMHRLNPAVAGESVAHAVYEYSGATAVVEAGWKHSALTQGCVLLACSEAEAWYEGSLTRGPEGRLRISEGDRLISDESFCAFDEYVESFYLFERECADAMLGRGHVTQSGAENLRSLMCTIAAYDAACSGAIVEIP
ncbi:MAG: Gfo/Idh/MocA family protein [Terriglobales bacterium]